MVQSILSPKKVNTVATIPKFNDVKLKNKDSVNQCMITMKCKQSVSKYYSSNQMEWLWKHHKKAKANGDFIRAAKVGKDQPCSSRHGPL